MYYRVVADVDAIVQKIQKQVFELHERLVVVDQ